MTNQDEEQVRYELIQKRAYEIHQLRGSRHGFDEQDWLEAELEIDGRRADDEIFPEQEHDEPIAEEITGP
jgi:hypothetical protein